MADQHTGEGSSRSATSAEGSESAVELNIKTLDSRIYSFRVNQNMLVSLFKEKIADKIGVPVGQQRLIFRGKVLKDDLLLSEYHVENGHTLHLVERQPVQSQPSSNAGPGESNDNNSNRENDAGAGIPRNRAGQISHSVVLGAFNVGDQVEGAMPDLNRVIGSVLNSFGIGNQTTAVTSNAQPTSQASQGNVTEGNQAHGGPTIPLHIPLPGLALPVHSLQASIPHSLYTISEFVSRMQLAFPHSGHQPNPTPSNQGDSPMMELPLNAQGLPTVDVLIRVLHRVQQLLNNQAVAELSHLAGRLENERSETDPTVRGQIQAESMQVGLAMQHLGSLFLELGRTLSTLQMGQSPAESLVNAGPAVFISALGPNPIMVQPFPFQANSLFGSGVPPLNTPGPFGPVGIGSAPRHVNIHIHAGTSLAPAVSAAGMRPNSGEGLQGEPGAYGSGSETSTQPAVVPIRNIIATAVPRPTGVAVSSATVSIVSGAQVPIRNIIASAVPRPTGVSVSGAAQPIVSSAQAPSDTNSVSTLVAEVDSQMRNIVGNMGGNIQASSGVPENPVVRGQSVETVSDHDVGSNPLSSVATVDVGREASVSLPATEDGGPKDPTECCQNNNGVGGTSSSDIEPAVLTVGGPTDCSSTRSAEETAKPNQPDDDGSKGPTGVPLGLGLSGLHPKRAGRASKPQRISGAETPNVNEDDGRRNGQQIVSSSSTGGSTDGNDEAPPLLGQIMGSLQTLSGRSGVGSVDGLRNMVEQFQQNPLIRETANQISQQIDSRDIENMISGLGGGSGSGGVDLSRMVQQMMPIVSRALGNVPAFAEQHPNAEQNDQVNVEEVRRRIEQSDPPADIFRSMVGTTLSSGNGMPADDLMNELGGDECLANEYMEMLRSDALQRSWEES